MGYAHIDNLYRNQLILLFRECYALEKVHGTSANVMWKDGQVKFHAGGESNAKFSALFDLPVLTDAFQRMGHPEIVVHGEAYGGKQQAQAWRYGPNLKFVAFDVRVGDTWLTIPNASDLASKLGLEFVHYVKVATDLTLLNAERDAPSEQARRNGVDGDKPREGVVLRPLIEVTTNTGQRIVAKHKRDEERETKTPRSVVDPAKLQVLENAEDIAQEWVTPTRLEHVLDKMPPGTSIENMRDVIAAMVADVMREGHGEIVDSKEARTAIGRMTAKLFQQKLKNSIGGA